MFDTAVKSVGLFLTRNSSTILTSLAVVGVVSTAVLAVRGTPGAMKSVEKLKDESPEHSNLDMIKVVAPHYIPAAVTGTVTIASIISAHSISSRKSAALASAYSLVDRSFMDYRKKIAETFGAQKADKASEDVVNDRIRANPVGSELYLIGEGEVLCYEVLTDRYFKSSAEKIRRAQNTLNARLLDGIDFGIPMNELYSLIGLNLTGMGDELGWNQEARLDLKISTHLTDGERPALAISYGIPPFPNYWKINK